MGSLGLISRALLLALLVGLGECQSNTVPPTDAYPECLVCGEGKVVGNPGKALLTEIGFFTCAGIAGVGVMGNIPEDLCSSVQTSALESCDCKAEDASAGGATDAPIESPYPCSVCANDKVVTSLEGIVYIPSQPNRTCGEYAQATATGAIQETQCELLQQFTDLPCGCEVRETAYKCSVCGEGMMVSEPDATVLLPNGEYNTCAGLENSGLSGEIPEALCSTVQPFAMEACYCKERPSDEVTEMVTAAPSFTPVVRDCPICGKGMAISIPEGIVEIPTQPSRTCSQLSDQAAAGNITTTQCILMNPYVFEACGCTTADVTDEPSQIPSDAPSLAPTLQPTVSPAPSGYSTPKAGCFDNLAEIHALEMALDDTSLRRRYILCPGTTFNMGTLDQDGTISEGEPFIMLRPNVIYQCGVDGSKQNNCILKGGDFAVTSYYGVFEGIYETVENVEIKGLTFQSQKLFVAVLEAAGDVEFNDCVFKMQGNMVPVLLQWKGDGPNANSPTAGARHLRMSSGRTGRTEAQLFYQRYKEGSPTASDIEGILESNRRLQGGPFHHSVTFQNCVFRDNYVVADMGFPGIIENTFGSELNVINCLFTDNKYGQEDNPSPFGYAIRSFGPLTVESTCFVDNVFFNHGPVEVYGTSYSATKNHVSSSQTDLHCEFISLFLTQDDLTSEDPTCIDADARVCSFSQPPTLYPTSEPTTLMPPSEPPVQSADTGSSSASTIHLIPVGLLSIVAMGLSL